MIFNPIEKYGSKWIQELPRVVWGLRTQRSRATGYYPLFMVYGSEAILPTDIAFGAPHTQNYDEGEAETTRRTDLDSAEEHCLTAASSTPSMSSSYVIIMTKTSSSATSTSATWYSDGSSPPEAS